MLSSSSNFLLLPFYSFSAPPLPPPPHQRRAKAKVGEKKLVGRYSSARRLGPIIIRSKSANGNARGGALRQDLGQSPYIHALDCPGYDLGFDLLLSQALDDGIASKNLADISDEGKNSPVNGGEPECQRYGGGKFVELADDAAADSSAAADNQVPVASPQDAFEARDSEEKLLEEAGSSVDGKQGGPERTVTQKVTSMHNFKRKYVSSDGILIVQVMKKEHLNATEELLVDSFSELMWGPLVYRPLLAITVRRYLRAKVKLFPNTVTLVGFYAPAEDNMILGPLINSVPSNWLLAGTVEVSFSDADKIPTVPPLGFPYLCNMAVDKRYRRQGIGWQLLRAAEELAAIKGYKQMHLHCRVIDAVPLHMYKKAGYKIIATDSIWILLSFQRRRHLMVKSLETLQLAAVDLEWL